MADIKLIIDDHVLDQGDVYKIIAPLLYTVEIHDTKELYESTLSTFTENQRYAFAILWYEHEVNNGGHQQFLRNSTGIVWKDVLEGLGKLELTENFAILTTLINIAGGDFSFDRATRNRQVEGIVKELNALDDKFYQTNQRVDIEKSLLKFINDNRRDFYFEGLVKNQNEGGRKTPTANKCI